MTTTGHEEEFRRLFEQESRTRLDQLAELALELERHGADEAIVAAMFRHAHTLKGGAGVVGFEHVAAVIHELEDVIDEVRTGRRPATPALADAVLGAVDALRAMVAQAMAGQDQSASGAQVRAALAQARAPRQEVARPAAASAPEPVRRPAEAIPVPVRRLDELVRLVGEGTAAQLRVGRLLSHRLSAQPDAIDEYRDLERTLGALQQNAIRARMVSVGSVAAPMRRAARDLGRQSGKQVRWEITGGETQLDRHVLERLREPLVALVRNAVDHGIEDPEERVAADKDPVGTVALHAEQAGAHVVVTVTDDGRGIDLDEVRRAIGDQSLSDEEAVAAVFRPGLSTAARLTGVSGRGVGLDEVRAAVDELRGQIEVHSAPGEGTQFRIRVPMTLVLLRCLIVRSSGESYAVPMHATAALLGPEATARSTAEGRPIVWLDEATVDVTSLATLLGGGPSPEEGPLVVLSTPAGRHAFAVDEIAGQRDVMVKDLGRLLPRLDLVAGASVEPDGRIMLVLDPGGLLRAVSDGAVPAAARERELPAAPGARLLVVDDSMMIRELQRSVLTRAGYRVTTASTGDEALELLERADFDLVLTDIEMPGMDGVALTKAIRGSDAHGHLPVVILTSHGAEDDRRRGLEAGADAYLVKREFDRHDLIGTVRRLLGER